MIVAVVEAMPFWVKVRLYGAAGPVSWSRRSWRTVTASSCPVISWPRKLNRSLACRVSKCTSS